ncbi:Bestrophin, RFP-TM, chloride channel-domain-containing protein [Pelagophyceae sp. CCMP2097]|nr:Bestrophin, RFP-TM, chloride channel-domain-containing protein [Pelagophyceae sp. CCMP2097]
MVFMRRNAATGRVEDAGRRSAAQSKDIDGARLPTFGNEPADDDDPLVTLVKDFTRCTSTMTEDKTLATYLISPFAGSLMLVWDHATWRRHQSMWRYVWYLQTWHMSTVLKRISGPVVALVVWTLFIRHANFICGGALTLPAVAVSIPAASIGLLLVFRTNQANARVNEARKLWGMLGRAAVDAAQILSASVDPKHDDGVAKIARLLAAAPWVLKAILRDGEAHIESGGGGAHDAVRVLLGSEEAAFVLDHVRGTSIFRRLMLRLRQLCAAIPLDEAMSPEARFSAQQRLAISMDGLHGSAGSCFRLFMSPIPPTYQRHVTRTLIVWLCCIPLSLPENLPLIATLLTVTSIAYLTCGIDEIAIQIELPFCVMPLHEYCLSTTNAVAEAVTALRQAPPLPRSLQRHAEDSGVPERFGEISPSALARSPSAFARDLARDVAHELEHDVPIAPKDSKAIAGRLGDYL